MLFIESIAEMSRYMKFIKYLISNRRELEKASKIILNEQGSTTIMQDIPTKMRDPGSLKISYEFGNSTKMNSLADSGASINLMPYFFYQKLNLSELKTTIMAIHMENRSITYPRGIIEDLLVKIGKFVFLINFVVLYIKEDKDVPIILRILF